MSVSRRLEALASAFEPSTRRNVIVIAADGTHTRPGDVVRDGKSVGLYVSEEHQADPMAGLTEEQARVIGPYDRVIVVAYVDGEGIGVGGPHE